MLSRHLSIASLFSPGFYGRRLLLQADAGGDMAVRPELGKVESLPDRPRDLEFERAAPAYDLGCDVDHFTSQGVRVGRDRYDVTADILFEGLVEEERNAQEVVERGIGAKALKGKPLIGKLLEDAESQLASAAVMVACPEKLIEVGRKAVESNIVPLWEFTNETKRLEFTHSVDDLIPIKDYLFLIGKYKHLDTSQLELIEEIGDIRIEMLNNISKS